MTLDKECKHSFAIITEDGRHRRCSKCNLHQYNSEGFN